MLEPGIGSLREQVHAFVHTFDYGIAFRHHPQPAENSSSTVVGSFEYTARLTHSSVSHMASSGGRTVAALAAQSLMHGDHQR